MNVFKWRFLALIPLVTFPVTSAHVVAPSNATSAQPCPTYCDEQPVAVYRTVLETEYRERHYQVARPVWETTMREERTRASRPVWETQEREVVSTVRRPVVETSYRSEPVTVYEPVTTYQPVTIDQGRWVEQQVLKPGVATNRLRWVPAGWAVDEKTGLNYWKLPSLRWVRDAQPGTYVAQRVWQPNVVTMQTPQTTLAPRVQTRQIPVLATRYVEEQQVRKEPVQVCRMVEEEVVRQVPVRTLKTVYEERVERVPTQVARQVLVNGGSNICRPADADPADMTPRPELGPSQPVPAIRSPALPPSAKKPATQPSVVAATSSRAVYEGPLVPVTFGP